MENKIDIYSLLPEEIDELIKKLTIAFKIVKTRKNTNSKFVDSIKEDKECPRCHSQHIIKNGHDKKNVQTYKYKECNTSN